MSDQNPPAGWGQPAPPPPPGPAPAPAVPAPPGPGAPPPGYQYPPAAGPQHVTGYTPSPRKPLDLPKLVFIAAWVVLGMYGLWFIYTLTQDDFGTDFGDRLFGGLLDLATGIFYTAVLLAISVWLRREDERKAKD